ncbi:MAG: YolD-like family protein [Lachnospiraceae bacterium]|nr:YolD-like family protein [Lachnospiraceae bacterium]
MANKPKNKMTIADRAKQFMPFAALKGLPDALALKEKITVDKIELSEEMAEALDQEMHKLAKGKIAMVVYFYKEEYLKITGMVARIDETSRLLQIVNTKIPFDDILEVNVE